MENEIKDEIERLRTEMIKIAKFKGLNDLGVMELSREIDRLHNLLLTIKQENNVKERTSSLLSKYY